tara:strand:+ start:555 stop:788 length:234 start_codon:yes stop_codon:yes gene_type:complete
MTDTKEKNEHSIMTNEQDANERKSFLLNQENFDLLMKTQRDIEEKTEMRPTFKKLINALVTEESLNSIKTKMINQMS